MSDYKYVSTKPLEEFEVVKKARTSDDSISRQDAIKVASNACGEFRGIFGRIEDGLRELPSAQKRGKWIDAWRPRLDGTRHWYRECDQCGYERDDDNPDKDTNFCPSCGANMKGDTDEI